MIDTAAKRLTISNVMCAWRMLATPPSGTSSRGERLANGFLYASDATVLTAGDIGLKNVGFRVATASGSGRCATALASFVVPIGKGTLRDG